MKMKVGGLTPGEDIQEVAGIRKTIGDNVLLMADANGAYDSRTAIQVGRGLQALGCAWFEEPVRRGDLDGYQDVRRVLQLPITGGEHLGSLDAFREYVSRRAVDVLQPDVANCGGLSAARRSRRWPRRSTCASSRTSGDARGRGGRPAPRRHAALDAAHGHADPAGPGAALRV